LLLYSISAAPAQRANIPIIPDAVTRVEGSALEDALTVAAAPREMVPVLLRKFKLVSDPLLILYIPSVQKELYREKRETKLTRRSTP
jgi:hypothetical protein